MRLYLVSYTLLIKLWYTASTETATIYNYQNLSFCFILCSTPSGIRSIQLLNKHSLMSSGLRKVMLLSVDVGSKLGTGPATAAGVKSKKGELFRGAGQNKKLKKNQSASNKRFHIDEQQPSKPHRHHNQDENYQRPVTVVEQKETAFNGPTFPVNISGPAGFKAVPELMRMSKRNSDDETDVDDGNNLIITNSHTSTYGDDNSIKDNSGCHFTGTSSAPDGVITLHDISSQFASQFVNIPFADEDGSPFLQKKLLVPTFVSSAFISRDYINPQESSGISGDCFFPHIDLTFYNIGSKQQQQQHLTASRTDTIPPTYNRDMASSGFHSTNENDVSCESSSATAAIMNCHVISNIDATKKPSLKGVSFKDALDGKSQGNLATEPVVAEITHSTTTTDSSSKAAAAEKLPPTAPKKARPMIQRKNPTQSIANMTTKEQRAIRTLLVVLITFVIMWFPFFTVQLIVAFLPQVPLPDNILFDLAWPGYISSGINPILYAIFNPEYKHSMKALARDFTCLF